MTLCSRDGLPGAADRFVGRGVEVQALQTFLAEHRLVTLTGLGGMGKTRLALEVAQAVVGEFRDGAVLVELAGVRGPGAVNRAVADALGLRDDSLDVGLAIVGSVANRELLLVLDNCEHVIGEAADLVGGLIAGAPRVSVMVTSREVLAVTGELVVEIAPLSLPESDEPDEVMRSDAVAMFVDRARLVRPDFEVNSQNRPQVAELCRRLDGMPLALELAAVRLRAVSVDEMLSRLDDVLSLLVRGGRTRPRRQQTMRATLDWSHELCSTSERRAWERLSVFTGGFTIDAACYVLDADADILDLLEGLVDKSIVSRAGASEPGQDRYHLLEVIRQYGAERLERCDDRTRIRRAHADYYRGIVSSGAPEEAELGDLYWFRMIRREMANIRTALQFLMTEGDQTRAVDVVTALQPYWFHTAGATREGMRWAQILLEQCSLSKTHLLQIQSLLKILECLLGDSASAGRVAEAILQWEGTPEYTALAGQFMLGDALMARAANDNAGAIAFAEAAAERAQFDEDPHTRMHALLVGATVALDLNDDAQSASFCTRLEETADAHKSHLMKANAKWIAGVLKQRHVADLVAPRAELAESIALFQCFPGASLSACSVAATAYVASGLGKNEHAATLLGAVGRMWNVRQLPLTRDTTRRMTRQTEADCRRLLGDDRYGSLAAAGGDLDDAAVLRLAAEALREDVVRPRGPAVPGADAHPLSRRQFEVARLVAEGLTNSQIAERLVISHRTAESHVASILLKLEFRSRSQIAVWVNELLHHSP
ncbi:ATP-binding protein [Gordonia terrae]|uniref:ATP-binding protein n=1 Tax=Gordonia terrae TaxID=2055 RepID=UPI003F6C94FD